MNRENSVRNRKKRWLFIDCIMIVLFLLLDQFIKYRIVEQLKPVKRHVLIQGWLELRYQENAGGAWGILQNQIFFFVFVTSIILLVVVYLMIKMPGERKYNVFHIALMFLSAGALGNMTDRIQRGYVIDYIYLSKIHFPVFNLADIYVTGSSLLLLILFVFIYKEDDLSFLNMTQKKYRELK